MLVTIRHTGYYTWLQNKIEWSKIFCTYMGALKKRLFIQLVDSVVSFLT